MGRNLPYEDRHPAATLLQWVLSIPLMLVATVMVLVSDIPQDEYHLSLLFVFGACILTFFAVTAFIDLLDSWIGLDWQIVGVALILLVGVSIPILYKCYSSTKPTYAQGFPVGEGSGWTVPWKVLKDSEHHYWLAPTYTECLRDTRTGSSTMLVTKEADGWHATFCPYSEGTVLNASDWNVSDIPKHYTPLMSLTVKK